LPESVRRIQRYGERRPTRVWAHARLTADTATSLVADVAVCDDAGERVADILGLRLVRADPRRLADDGGAGWYRFEWEPDDRAPRGESGQASTRVDAAPAAAAPYLIFADEHGAAEALAKRLDALGRRSILVREAGALGQEAAVVAAADVCGVIHCWS